MIQISMSNTTISNKTGKSKGFLQSEPIGWEATTKGYEKDIFYYGKGMEKKYLTSSARLEHYIGDHYGTGALAFTLRNQKKVRGKPPAKTRSELASMDEDDKEIRKHMLKEYAKKLLTLEDTTGRVYHFLMSHCHPTLLTRMRQETEFILLDGDENSYELWQIIYRVCNSNNVGENPVRVFLESVYDFMMIQGDKCDDIGSYLDLFEQRAVIAEKDGMKDMFATIGLRDSCLKSYVARKDVTNEVYLALKEWKEADDYVHVDLDEDDADEQIAKREDAIVRCIALATHGRETLYEKVKAMIYLKRSGSAFYAMKDDYDNDFAKGHDNFPWKVSEQHRSMCLYKPPYVPPAKIVTQKTIPGDSHLQKDEEKKKNEGGQEPGTRTGVQHLASDAKPAPLPKGYACFRCGRNDCVGAKFCTETTKEDGTPVNSNAVSRKLLEAQLERTRVQKEKEETSGAQHYMNSEIVPTFEETIEKEEPHDGYCHTAYLFNQTGNIEDYAGDIEEDATRYTNHVYNQTSEDKRMSKLEMWLVLLDSQSTSDVFVNGAFLKNIRKCKWTLRLRTQSGVCSINMIGDLPGVGTVWYYPEGVANILSQHRMITLSKWRVKFDSDLYYRTGNKLDLCYNCITGENVKVKFTPTDKGLHVLDCSDYFGLERPNTVFGTEITDNKTRNGEGMCQVNAPELNNSDGIDSIQKSEDRFCERDRKRARRARRLQYVSGFPSIDTMIRSAETNGLMNSPVTKRDLILSWDMLGTSEHISAGKTTKTQPPAINADEQLVELPPSIAQYYRDVEISVDVLHVNRLPFLASISKNIHYSTIDALDNMRIPTMESTIRQLMRSYSVRGFNVVAIHVDIQFKSISDRNVLGPTVNVVSRGEHVPEIERFIRVMKERARCYHSMLKSVGINALPKIMVMHLMRTVNFYLNAFVWRQGVSQILSPFTIVEGIALDYNKHFHVIFGEYLRTYEGTTNTMAERTTPGLALGPSGNLQGGIRVYSLTTGKILHRLIGDVTIMKMPAEAIRRLRYRTRREQSLPGLVFGDRMNNEVIDSHITGVEVNQNNNNNNESIIDEFTNKPTELSVEELAIDDKQSNTTNDDNMKSEASESPLPVEGTKIEDDDDVDPADKDAMKFEEDTGVAGVPPEHRRDEVQAPEVTVIDSDSEDEEPYRSRSGRVVKPFDYAKEYPTIYGESDTIIAEETSCYAEEILPLDIDEYQLYKEALQWFDFEFNEIDSMMFKAEHMSMQQGIHKYGEEGKKSALKEIANLTDNECFGEIAYNTLTQEMKDQALPILMFMIMKRNGNIKSRGVANGSVQRAYTDKEDCSSPTPDYYAFKYIIAVIAKEGRDCATVDLPGFFLQTEQEEEILLKLTGSVAILLTESDPAKWKKHLVKENGKDVIYVICNKAIYGTMNAALLAYKKLANLFKDWGFVMNPYDPCVWNKMVGKHQFSIMFHIDDLLMSHRKAEIVTLYIKKLEREYGKRDPLTVTRGLVHEYLGMTFDLRTKGQVSLSQYDYIKRMHDRLPDELNVQYRSTPAPADLFKQKEDDPPLDKKRQEQYHTITAETLWLSQRSRPDTQLATGYHCTRVKAPPTEGDWAKLSWEQGYIWKTRYIPHIIAITEEGAIVYIDGAHAIHTDAKGHSGLYATMGKGAMINVSKKLSLNTLSSTETEIVSTGERLPKCIWFRYFRISQGDEPREDVLMQDNKSAMILQKNWPYSTRKGSQHINIKYFFATDKIKNKEIKMIHCPTEEMIADYNSKPLQGKLFYDNRNRLMGLNTEDFDKYKEAYVEILKSYELYENEDDLSKV